MDNDIYSSKKIILSLVFITLLVITVIVLSFFTYSKNNGLKNSNIITTGNVSMTYSEDTNGISIKNAMPTADKVGKSLVGKNEYFDFTISYNVPSNQFIEYEITAVKDDNSTVDDKDIKIYLEKQNSGSYEELLKPTTFKPIGVESSFGSPEGSMILQKVKKSESGNDNYRLRIWLSDEATVSETAKYYSIKIFVYGKS